MSILNKNTCPRGGVASHRRKHGFTITELVIVIAVIAILAAVLIPTFANLINKANESADLQTVKNLNTILASEQTVSQKKPSTMSEALAQAAEGGYTVEKLSPTSEGNDILWDQDSNRFVLADKDGKIIFKDDSTKKNSADGCSFWKITDSESEIQSGKFSYYLKESFTATELSVTTGIDVGANDEIFNITYDRATAESAQEVVFNVNGGSLTINAPLDTVKHYGKTEIVNIKSVADHSYYEYGQTEKIELKEGHIAVQSNATVNYIIVTSDTVENFNITLNSGCEVNAVASTVSAISSALKNKVNGSAASDVDIITEPVSEDLNNFAGGFGTEKHPYIIYTIEQFKKIKSGTSDSKLYYILGKDLDFSEITGSNVYVFSSPVQHIELDGNGKSITNLGGNGSGYVMVFNSLISSTIRNLDLRFNCVVAGSAGMLIYESSGNVILDNVDVYGILNYNQDGRNQSPYIYRSVNGSLTFTNCDNYADINATAYNAAFIGYAPIGNTVITLKNCNNYGDIVAGNASMILANKSGFAGYLKLENVCNYGTVMGMSSADLICWGKLADEQYEGEVQNVGSGACAVMEKLDGFGVSIDEDKQIIVTPAASEKVDYYLVTVSMYVNIYYKSGEFWGTDMVSIEVKIPAEQFNGKSGLYNYEFRQLDTGLPQAANAKYALSASDYSLTDEDIDRGYKIITIDGVNYYLLTDNINRNDNNLVKVITSPKATIKVYAYDSDNNLVGLMTQN